MTKLSVLCPLLVSLVACVDNSSDEGVDVTLGEQSFEVRSNGLHASMTWDDKAAVLSAGDRDVVFATADDLGTWTVQPDTLALVEYAQMLDIGERKAASEMALPWRQKQAAVSNACNTTSTWVFYGNCNDCYTAAREESGLGPTWVDQSTSCSYGSVWTTCSVTRCRNVEQVAEEAAY